MKEAGGIIVFTVGSYGDQSIFMLRSFPMAQKVTIDEKECIGCESCVEICPEVFNFNEEKEDAECVDEAVASCPTDCTEVEDECLTPEKLLQETEESFETINLSRPPDRLRYCHIRLLYEKHDTSV